MQKERRRAVDKEIEDLRLDFIRCSDKVSDSVEGLAKEVKALRDDVTHNNENGLKDILKEYRDQKGFVTQSEKYGRWMVMFGKAAVAIMGIAITIGGVIAAIGYYFSHNGTWPSGLP